MPDWKKNLKIFLLGAVWAALAGAVPAGTMIYDWLMAPKAAIDWHEVGHIAVSGAVFGVVCYWRKHRALLTLPPDMAEVLELQKSAQDQQKKGG